MENDITKLTNKRILIKESLTNDYNEVEILEISPSKFYVKIERLDKRVYWLKVSTINVIEVLN